MRVKVVAESILEHLALALNRVPTPVAESLWGPAASALLIAGVRSGIFSALADGPRTADQLTQQLSLSLTPTQLLLDSLVVQQHVRRKGVVYRLAPKSRRWLDPGSPLYVGDFIASHQDYWQWWSSLSEVIVNGKHFEMHTLPREDPYWQSYITGQFELARLSAPEVAATLRLPPPARTLLDVAGGHGWFSAELCRRHPQLHATVIDLPGGVDVGRAIIAQERMQERVTHREGDVRSTDFGGPYDIALCFNLIHHLQPDEVQALFRKIHDSLVPGGALAILDLFRKLPDDNPDMGSVLGLFFYLQSGADTYSPEQVAEWLNEAGFDAPRRVAIRRIPVQTLYQTVRRA